MEITLTGINKSFEEGGKSSTILMDLNARFPANRFSVILGRSGSGKSTILNLISGIDTPDSGKIRIGGKEVSSMTDYQRTLFRRHHIGFIFQFFNLIPTLTVMENVMLVMELDGKGTQKNRGRSIQILEQVGLGDRLNSKPDNLSGGEQQRTAIARALAYDPGIILADEPTGNLDQETGDVVLKILIDLIREKGKTLVMATHSNEILKSADVIFGIQESKLVELQRL